MDEDEFDASRQGRPFKREDATRAESAACRSTALGVALWGRTAEHLQRQLLGPHPEIPSGFDLADFRELLRSVQMVGTRVNDPRFAWASRFVRSSRIISVGTQSLTEWEARSEIVRRAIEYLEAR
jgi:hypothetical protein